MMEWLALLGAALLVLAGAFAVGYRQKARSEYRRALEQRDALLDELAKLREEQASLQRERLLLQEARRNADETRAALLDRYSRPNAELSGPSGAAAKGRA